jgi:hypothetical protein
MACIYISMLKNIAYLRICHVTVVIDFFTMFNIDCGKRVVIKIFSHIEKYMSVLIDISIG